MIWAYLLQAASISYVIGSIPTGYLIVKAKTGKDIREIGSGSTGATNVKRARGKKWFFIGMLFTEFRKHIRRQIDPCHLNLLSCSVLIKPTSTSAAGISVPRRTARFGRTEVPRLAKPTFSNSALIF